MKFFGDCERSRRKGEIPEAKSFNILNGQTCEFRDGRKRVKEENRRSNKSRDKSHEIILRRSLLTYSAGQFNLLFCLRFGLRSFSPENSKTSLENRFINDSEINEPSLTLLNKN